MIKLISGISISIALSIASIAGLGSQAFADDNTVTGTAIARPDRTVNVLCESARIPGEIQAVEALELTLKGERALLGEPQSDKRAGAEYASSGSTHHAAWFTVIDNNAAFTDGQTYFIVGFFVFDAVLEGRAGSLVVQFEDDHYRTWNEHFHCQ